MKRKQTSGIQEDKLINNAGKHHYFNTDAPEILIKYVTRAEKNPNNDLIAWGGLGVSESLGINTVIDQFYYVQNKRTRQGNFGRYMDHEIYSFSTESETAINNLNVDVDKIARRMTQDFYNTDNCQVVYDIHKPTDKDTHLHIHFVINTVNFVNGNKRRENMRQTKERETRFLEIVEAEIYKNNF